MKMRFLAVAGLVLLCPGDLEASQNLDCDSIDKTGLTIDLQASEVSLIPAKPCVPCGVWEEPIAVNMQSKEWTHMLLGNFVLQPETESPDWAALKNTEETIGDGQPPMLGSQLGLHAGVPMQLRLPLLLPQADQIILKEFCAAKDPPAIHLIKFSIDLTKADGSKGFVDPGIGVKR